MPEHFEPATVEQYEEALLSTSSRIGDTQREMLQVQYAAPEKTATAPELADAVGYDSWRSANLHYGRLGRTLSDELERTPKRQTENDRRWWSVISTGESTDDGFKWTMRPQFASALENLDWVKAVEQPLPEEVPEAEVALLREGAVREVKVNAYERSAAARRQCIEHHGTQCYVCGFDFEKRYGEAGEGFIHVHHEKPLATAEREQEVDPIADLKPVCPNCHGIIHRRTPPYTIEETQQMLR